MIPKKAVEASKEVKDSGMVNGTIDTIAFGGSGILRHDGLVIFIPFTAPQDLAAITITHQKKNFAEGKLLRLLEPSPLRTAPTCSHFGTCGGCQLQHLAYPAQLQAKRTFILDSLNRIGKIPLSDITVHPALAQWHYRRHIRLTLKNQAGGFSAGYLGTNPSEFVPVSECPIFHSPETPLLRSLHPLLSTLSNEGIEDATLRIIKADGNKFLLAFHTTPDLPKNHTLAQKTLDNNPLLQGILFHSPKKTLHYGNITCTATTLGIKARFSPFGFVQNHPEQSEKLYQALLDNLPPTRTLLDLYCGIGITSLLFARQNIKVTGIESHPETLALAKENARLNNLTVQFHEGKAETLAPALLKQLRPDTLLCNPPRTGLDPKLLAALTTEKPPCILYVSCMPSTLARDLKELLRAGYKIAHIEAFDMFPQTTHVETLVKLTL